MVCRVCFTLFSEECEMGKPVIKAITAVTKQISDAIQKHFRDSEFSSGQIAEKTGVPCFLVSRVLVYKAAMGPLLRVRTGVYKLSRDEAISSRLPSAFVAEKTWKALRSARGPMAFREIVAATEKLAVNDSSKRCVSLRMAVNRLLYVWHKNGMLIRRGEKRSYDYEIKRGILNRPTATWKPRPISTARSDTAF